MLHSHTLMSVSQVSDHCRVTVLMLASAGSHYQWLMTLVSVCVCVWQFSNLTNSRLITEILTSSGCRINYLTIWHTAICHDWTHYDSSWYHRWMMIETGPNAWETTSVSLKRLEMRNYAFRVSLLLNYSKWHECTLKKNIYIYIVYFKSLYKYKLFLFLYHVFFSVFYSGGQSVVLWCSRLF